MSIASDWRHTTRQSLITSLTFDHLFTFQTIARTGSFRAAAAELALTQPAVSQRIRHLERILGCTLLERHQGARSQLTTAGRELVRFADEMLGRAASFHENLERMKDVPERQTLTVVSDSDHIKHLLIDAVAAMKTTAPTVNVVIRHGPSRESCMEELSEGRADLGLCRSPTPTRFGNLGMIEERMYLYAPPDSPIHDLDEGRRLAYLESTDFATFADGMRSRELVDRWAEKVGITLQIALESRGLESMRRYVTRGLALGVLPEFCVTGDLRRGRLVAVDLPGLPLVRGAAIISPPGQPVSQAARLFLSMLPAKIDSTLNPAPEPRSDPLSVR